MESMMLLLDAILVPDFGQTKFDDQILNLGPFEQQFNENRSFLQKELTCSVRVIYCTLEELAVLLTDPHHP
jgi:hypothetical protein